MDDNLRQRLKRMGVVKGFKALQTERESRPPLPPRAEKRALPGEKVATVHGPVWVERRVYPATHVHGRYPLGDVAALPPGALDLLGTPALGDRPAFLDTETTGLAGGAGTLVFLTGVGVWAAGELTLHLVFLRDPAEEPAALRYIENVIEGATGLVTFNGRGFDVPLLESRFILNRLPPLCLDRPHLDLLGVARQLWRDHLPSRRLGVLETELLGIRRAEQDIDSSLIPWIYREYLRTDDPTQIARVFYHNLIDVLSLVTLLTHTARVAATPEAMALAPAEWAGVGRLRDRADDESAAFAAWERALDNPGDALALETAGRLWREMSTRCKRCGAWERALEMWAAWIERDPLATEPLVEQAKYHEWQTHDLTAALAATETALRRFAAQPAGEQNPRTQAELEHRHARLRHKLNAEAHRRKAAENS